MSMGSTGDLVAGRYLLEAPLGAGNFGEVWRAVDTHRRYRVALKLMRQADPRAAWHEASLLTALTSKYILQVNNADRAVDVPYLDTALAVCSLDKPSEGLGVEPGLAVGWIRCALRGLDLCHRRGLLHRDVKPANVFLTEEGDAQLGDFGVAALMDSDGSAPAHGDARISAPELFAGERSTVASDVYSTAVTLYALLSGRLPFDHCSAAEELEAAVVAADYPDLRDIAPHVSQALAARVRTGMEAQPQDRFESAAAFDSALALSRSARRFEPVSPHDDHVRCWLAVGKGPDLDVCVVDVSSDRSARIETRRAKSGTRVVKHCDAAVRTRVLPAHLRKLFNALRAG